MTKREKQKIGKANQIKLYLEKWDKEKACGMSLSAFCRNYDLSRKTFYRWIGGDGRRKNIINRTSPVLKAKAIDIFLRYKGTWSSETISMVLKGKLSAPTIRKLVAPYRQLFDFKIYRPKIEPRVLKTASIPNSIWSVDWTEYKIRGKKFFIFLFMDEASRYYLGWYVFTATPTGEDARFCLNDIFERYKSRPLALKSDRAKVFSCEQWISLLSENEVIPHKIRPHCPQDNGVIERGMRDVKTWLRANNPLNHEELKKCLDEGMFMLNFLKPKMVLESATPATTYFDSLPASRLALNALLMEDLCLVK